MRLCGTVRLRSSVASASARVQMPPGETEVLAMNPHRAIRICSLTGWPRLEAGSLNLVVPQEPFDALARLTPLWVEDGASIVYPARFADIPKKRGPYLYFRGCAKVGDRCEDVLVRRPRNPISNTIELYAPVNLMQSLAVADTEQVTVEVPNLPAPTIGSNDSRF
jgi:hypothetical protein